MRHFLTNSNKLKMKYQDSWEFNDPFQHKYGYIRDKRSGVESYTYPVKEGQRYINLNPGRLFCSAATQKGKGSRGSFKLLC